MFEEQNTILKFKLSNWLNDHKGFGVIAIVFENNRIHCQTYCLTIGYYSLDRELYVVNFVIFKFKL